MENINEITNNILAELKKREKEMKSYLKEAPEGTLRIQKKNKKPYYYWQVQNREGEYEQKYISKKDVKTAEVLAQKRYYEKIYPLVEDNIKALQNFRRSYHFDEIKESYSRLPEARKQLITPYEKSAEGIVRKWQQEVYEQNQMHPENLRFETDNGEMVRSKSELIIANMLNKNRKYLLYKYERPLDLLCYGERLTIHPDFTVLHIKTGRVIYWEHAGMMDVPKYAGDFVWKNNLYCANHLVPGRDVLFTYETQTNPLDTKIVKRMIEWIVSGS